MFFIYDVFYGEKSLGAYFWPKKEERKKHAHAQMVKEEPWLKFQILLGQR